MPTLHLAYSMPIVPITPRTPPTPSNASIGSSVNTAPTASALAATLTDLTAQHLRKRADLTAVRIEAIPAHQWSIGGTTLDVLGQASYRLAIDVTAGTNSDSEVAAFIRAVHDAMSTALGPVHPASYVLVQTQGAAQWGWGGHTQAHRMGSPFDTLP